MARAAFVVTDAMRERARYLAGVGVPQDDIAKIIGCAPKTLRKRFRDDLDRGVAEANATMCGYLFASAKAGNIAAIIFWLKTRAWREGMASDDSEPLRHVGAEFIDHHGGFSRRVVGQDQVVVVWTTAVVDAVDHDGGPRAQGPG